MKVAVLLNAEGNTIARSGPDALRDQVADLLAARGVEAELRLVRGRDLAQAIKEVLRTAARPDAATVDAIVVGGGDGSISTAAGLLLGGDVALGILPLGTLNHLAKDLGVPLDLPAAVGVIAAGHVSRIDCAEVNGRIFVNNSSLGFYPEMLADRIRQQHQLGRGKWTAAVIAFLRVLRDFPLHRFAITTAHGVRPRKTPCAFIGNNCYAVSPPSLGAREAIDRGELCIYVARRQSRFGWVALVVKALFHGLSPAADFELVRVGSVEIASHRRRLRVAVDGELETMTAPLRYRCHPRALKVLTPAGPA